VIMIFDMQFYMRKRLDVAKAYRASSSARNRNTVHTPVSLHFPVRIQPGTHQQAVSENARNRIGIRTPTHLPAIPPIRHRLSPNADEFKWL
jgi:hypothetical protein